MKLKPDPFEAIKNGTKTIEIRLNDEKRQRLSVGDEIVFSKLPELKEILSAEVVKLEAFDNFTSMLKVYPLVAFGANRFNNAQDVLDAVRIIYSEEDEERYGVLAIHVEVKKNR